MSATIHFVSGPQGADRLSPLLAAYQAATANSFGTAAFLAASRRHADEIRDALGTGLAPLVFELQAFADELVRIHEPAHRPHSDLQRRLLIDSVLRELRDSGELPYFAGVADTRAFAEAAGAYIAKLKEAGIDLRHLLKMNPGRGKGNGSRQYQAARIFERYQRRLAKARRLDPPDRLGRATELWVGGRRHPFHRVQTVFLVGFTALSRLERKLLDAVRETVEHVWLDVPEGEAEVFLGPRAASPGRVESPGELDRIPLNVQNPEASATIPLCHR